MKLSMNVPSYKRSRGVDILQYLPGVRIWVCETEAKQYRKDNPGAKIIPVPKGVQGNLCRIRNWILDEEYGRGVDAVCLMDDDIRSIRYLERRIYTPIPPEAVEDWMMKCTEVAWEWGARLWGVNCNHDQKSYREYTPFSTKAYINGPFSVHIHSDVRYDERMARKEDFDLTLQHMATYRRAIRFNKFHLVVKMGGSGDGQEGGCAESRNVIGEWELADRLQQKWGEKLIRFDKGAEKRLDINPILRVPIRGV